MRLRILAFTLATLAAGCQTAPTVINDVHTGNKVYAGTVTNAYRGAFDFLQARPFYSTKTGYGFNTLYSAYGWKHLSEAWSFGKPLNYEQRANDVGMCGGGTGCITVENGVVHLSESQFRQAAVSGFEFQLKGVGGSVVGKIPAAQFQRVLDLKQKG